MKLLLYLLIICRFQINNSDDQAYNQNSAMPNLSEGDIVETYEKITGAKSHLSKEHDAKPETESVSNFAKAKEKVSEMYNLDCEQFESYALNCTRQAAIIYNFSRKSPPKPSKIGHWCMALRRLIGCAVSWNTDCKDVTDDLFNEDSVNGLKHVIKNVCDDHKFLEKYELITSCVDKIMTPWEVCYINFKTLIDEQKNSSRLWTHYETHFLMCCARAEFRRCTFDTLFDISNPKCNRFQATILQRFSVIVSEGDVYQNCKGNVFYPNCPRGDPRPHKEYVFKALNREVPDISSTYTLINSAVVFDNKFHFVMYVFQLLVLVVYYNNMQISL